MIEVKIGNTEFRELSEWSQGEIPREINKRQSDGQQVCVLVRIVAEPDVNLVLGTPACASGGGSPDYSPTEEELIEIWKSMHLYEDDFTGGNVKAFLAKVSDTYC